MNSKAKQGWWREIATVMGYVDHIVEMCEMECEIEKECENKCELQ